MIALIFALGMIVLFVFINGVFDRREHDDSLSRCLRLAGVLGKDDEAEREKWVRRARYHAHHAGYHDDFPCECAIEFKDGPPEV